MRPSLEREKVQRTDGVFATPTVAIALCMACLFNKIFFTDTTSICRFQRLYADLLLSEVDIKLALYVEHHIKLSMAMPLRTQADVVDCSQ